MSSGLRREGGMRHGAMWLATWLTLLPRLASAAQSAQTSLLSLYVLLESTPWDRALQRYFARAEHSSERFMLTLSTAGMTWFWIAVSVLCFLAVVCVSAVADWKMLSLLRSGVGAFVGELFRGVRTFYRMFRDRHTPNYARLVLAGGLAYWLLPMDLISDDTIVPGFLEDIVVAVVSAKWFVYLCPDGVIARHARGVRESEEAVKH